MTFIRTIYCQTMRQIMFSYIFLMMFGIVCYMVFFHEKDEMPLTYFSNNDHNLTFWSNDFHISPIQDLKHLLTPLGVHFIDKSLSGSCGLTKTCAEDLQILSTVNGMNPNQTIRKQFYKHYKDHPEMNRVDAFLCFHPAAMCELFMPFNRTIIVIASTRYELGRFSVEEWNEWNKNLLMIASDPRNIVAGNNLYDAEYIRYFTGINPIVLPSICAYTNTVYRPSKTHPQYIYIPSRGAVQFNELFANELNLTIKNLNASIIVRSLRSLYKYYNYSDITPHPGIIYLPYQVSTMSIFEQYSMNIPLFFPSLDLLTEWHLKYAVVFERTWDKALTGRGKTHSSIAAFNPNSTVPDPNNEYNRSAVHYWLKFADFYQWPHIIHFHSINDLVWKLLHTNLTHVSEQMAEYNQRKRQALLTQWKIILNRISTSAFHMKKTKSL